MHQHGDGHRANASRDGRDGAALWSNFVEGDIADEPAAFGRGRVVDPVDANVDHGGAFLHEIGGDKSGFTDGGDEDVRRSADLGDVFRATVRDGDRGVASFAFVHEQQGHRFTDDHATSEHHGVCSGGFNAGFHEEPLAAERGARNESGRIAQRELGYVHGMETIDIFCWINGFNDRLLVDMRRGRGLNKDAVDGGVVVEFSDEVEQFGLGGGGRQFELQRVHAEVVGGFVFGAHVGLGGGVGADEDDGEAGGDAHGFEGVHGGAGFGVGFCGDGFSVDELHGKGG